VELSAEARRRLEHLIGLFEREGARLELQQEDDGAWRAVVRGAEAVRGAGAHVRAWTALEAAEVAWLKFQDALDLRGDNRDTRT
jgi:hypothetical protein